MVYLGLSSKTFHTLKNNVYCTLKNNVYSAVLGCSIHISEVKMVASVLYAYYTVADFLSTFSKNY